MKARGKRIVDEGRSKGAGKEGNEGSEEAESGTKGLDA